MELEGLSEEDQEFEVARQFVKFAGEAAKQAAQAPANVPPQEAAKSAVVTAAQQHAPGLCAQARPRRPQRVPVRGADAVAAGCARAATSC
jgi:hypothetical protein